MGQVVFERALVLAKLEAVFRTDPNPTELLTSFTGIDATNDVNDTNEQITITGHGATAGDGPFRASLTSGAFPTGMDATTNYFLGIVDANTVTIHLTRAAAIAGTSPVDLTDAVGVFALTLRQSDALLVADPNVTADITTVERTNVKTTLSPDPIVVTRKVSEVTFQHEVRGGGNTDGTLAPPVGRLLRGCGFAETLIPASSTESIINDVTIPVNSPTGAFTFAKTTAFAGTLPRIVVLQCTNAGGTGVAQFTVFSPAVGPGGSIQAEVNTTGVTMTNSLAFTLAESAQITPTITTDFALGDTYVFWLVPPGAHYAPVSTGFESLTLKVFFDGIMQETNGARGTFTVEGAGADYARYNFTFRGDFVDVVDLALPSSPNYGADILPPPVENASLFALGGKDFSGLAPNEFNLCAQSFTIDAGVELADRECINDPNAIAGEIITGRTPTFGFNPELELEAFHPFWANLSAAERLVWGVRVGNTPGNVTSFFAPYAQYTDIQHGNRADIRIYDITGQLSRGTDVGNDELQIHIS